MTSLETLRLELEDANTQIVALKQSIESLSTVAVCAIEKADLLGEGMLNLIEGIEAINEIDDMKWKVASSEFHAIDNIIHHRRGI